jgi:hypothetical protein
MGRYFVVQVIDREKVGEAVVNDDCTKIPHHVSFDISRRGQIGPDFALMGEAMSYADGLALQNLLDGSFVRSTAYFVFSQDRLEAGGFLAEYWTHGVRIANRVGERVAEILRG